MTHVVTENCIKCKYTDCVDVCPVDCFREGPNFLVIDPDECIDCGACELECPVEAPIQLFLTAIPYAILAALQEALGGGLCRLFRPGIAPCSACISHPSALPQRTRWPTRSFQCWLPSGPVVGGSYPPEPGSSLGRAGQAAAILQYIAHTLPRPPPTLPQPRTSSSIASGMRRDYR